ncbi:MAG: ankyrin repeat domain-containing protein [Bacteroidota bacterium]|nr:ankyrin repeat domain-containing protein [Bacteroidota bacterium]MDP4196379.1 ankyrin repeat domain-containing protein [Bacteroidota bacterium]
MKKLQYLLVMFLVQFIFFANTTSAQQYGGPNELLAGALLENNLQAARDAIRNGADVNAVNEAGETVIFNALTFSFFQADKFNTDMIKLLLDNGAKVNVKDKQGQTPLFIACSSGLIADEKRAELVELLISKGAKTETVANVNMYATATPLLYAAMNGFVKTAGLLIQKGANPRAKDEEGNNALYWIIKGDPSTVQTSDKIELIKLFLSKGVDPYNKNVNDETAIAFAEQSGSKTLVDALSGKKVSVKSKAKHQITQADLKNSDDHPENYLAADGRLTLAIRQGDIQAVKMALQDGAEVSLKNDQGNTPLMEAANFAIAFISDNNMDDLTSYKRRLEIIKFLVENGSDVNDVNNMSENALAVAVKTLIAVTGKPKEKLALDIISYLISKGSKVDIEAKTTPLMDACEAASQELVEILLPNVKNINKKSNDLVRVTAMCYAIGYEGLTMKNLNALQKYMKQSGNELPEIKNLPKDNQANFDPERTRIVKTLISHGADVNLASGGATPLAQAKAAGYDEIVKVLQKAGAKK